MVLNLLTPLPTAGLQSLSYLHHIFTFVYLVNDLMLAKYVNRRAQFTKSTYASFHLVLRICTYATGTHVVALALPILVLLLDYTH